VGAVELAVPLCEVTRETRIEDHDSAVLWENAQDVDTAVVGVDGTVAEGVHCEMKVDGNLHMYPNEKNLRHKDFVCADLLNIAVPVTPNMRSAVFQGRSSEDVQVLAHVLLPDCLVDNKVLDLQGVRAAFFRKIEVSHTPVVHGFLDVRCHRERVPDSSAA